MKIKAALGWEIDFQKKLSSFWFFSSNYQTRGKNNIYCYLTNPDAGAINRIFGHSKLDLVKGNKEYFSLFLEKNQSTDYLCVAIQWNLTYTCPINESS